MRVKRTAAIVLGGGALAAWLAGAATSNRTLPDPIVTRASAVDASGADLANEIAKLHERLRPSATPRIPGRNLFAFRMAPAAAAPAPPPAAIVELAPPRPVERPLKLAGIAEDQGPDGPVRTAFISADGQLFLVKEGEPVTAQYRVVKISADAVELVDVRDDTIRRLAMR